jgi:hypothetical protein
VPYQKGHPKYGGRAKGSINKATRDARQAIAAFVDSNAHRLQGWLDKIAEGVPKRDAKGKTIPGEFEISPNPEKAFVLFQSVIEYHIPKLGRVDVEHSGEIHQTFEHRAVLEVDRQIEELYAERESRDTSPALPH